MSVIKKWLPVLIVSIAIASIAFMVGCDWQAEFGQTRSEVTTGETVAAVKETVAEAKVKGTIYETELFSILVPDGWVTEELAGEDRFFGNRGKCRGMDYKR